MTPINFSNEFVTTGADRIGGVTLAFVGIILTLFLIFFVFFINRKNDKLDL
jgi:uncharacterized membrane protein